MSPSVIVVGGGISGLSVAFRIEQCCPGVEVLVLEQRGRAGGTIGTVRRDGFQVEIGPNGFLDNKPTTIGLCRELGLGDRLVAASEAAGRNRYLFLDGKLRLLPNSVLSFLRSDLLSWHGKLGLIAERWRRRRLASADESVDAFARRRAGPEVADVFADALVTGIYAGDPRLLSVRACFPRLARMEDEHGSILTGMDRGARQRRLEAKARGEARPPSPRMWSFGEGLGLVVDTLRDRLRHPPITGVTVTRVVGRIFNPSSPTRVGQVANLPDPRGVWPASLPACGRLASQLVGNLPHAPLPRWTVHAEGRDHWTADAVVLACPAYQQAAIVSELDAALADQVGAIPYNRVAVVALGYRREDVRDKLDGFGYIAPQRLQRDVLGVQWCSSTFPGRAPAGMVLLRALCGGWHRAEVAAWDDSRLLEAVRAELRLTLGVRGEPVFHHLVRWERAIPQYLLGHLDRVAWIDERSARYPGLFLAGNAYRGVALNDCTEQAELLALKVKNFLALPRGQ